MRWRFPIFVAILLGVAACAAETSLPLVNGGFEEGSKGWTMPADGMGTLSEEQAASGKWSLKIVDEDDKRGSNVAAARVPIRGGAVYDLRGKYFAVSGEGLGMYLRTYDAAGTMLNGPDSHLVGLGGTDRKWRSFAGRLYAEPNAASLEIMVHSYNAAKVTGYLDDLQLVDVGMEGLKPPWEGQYKLRLADKEKLTAADVVGPDGIVYPNWTRCGVQGGIPQVMQFATLERYGGKANDGLDDSAALDRACEEAGKAGGGAIALGAGTYYLDRPVTVRQGGVVIRGAGAGKTRVMFRYAVPPTGAAFFTPAAGAKVGKGTRLELHCRPTELQRMTMLVDDTVIGEWGRSTHSGNTFSFARYGRDAIGKVPDGPHVLKGTGTYLDGSKVSAEIPIVLDSTYNDATPVPNSRAAIMFEGQGYAGPKLKLAEDGKRGSTVLKLEKAEGLAVGDCILIDGPATERWKTLTQNMCLWGTYRRYETTVKRIEGNTVTLEQPLRIEFPVIDGSYVQKIVPIQRCGVEDLYLEQTENLWISSVIFSHGWNCWARGVTIKKMGQFPVYGSNAKWCEIRDCVFDDAWFKGGGGTAYAGWENSWDCLMDGIETFKLRHAPLFQWAASGCVIRRGVFHESDAQWHSGWTNENLFEQCVVESTVGNGGYGFGMWASPPEDTAHGPNGPRNVIYNCDMKSPKTGLWMGGMNENWIIVYNRFDVGAGPGIFAKTASFDHLISDNVFILRDGKSALLQLATPDCIGVELRGNKLYGGNGQFSSGIGKPEVVEGNVALPLGEAARPQPAVPSIYEWQQKQVK
ncbi:MAG: hypothetical protein ABFD94_21905 [Armatimonadia bacterium]